MDLSGLKDIQDCELFESINLEKYTTIKLAELGNILISKSVENLKEVCEYLVDKDIKYHVVGWGANQVLLNTKETLFIKLDFPLDKSVFKEVRDEYILPASTSLNLLTSHAGKFGLKGWKVFTGIPASFGGAICMNAGTALGEIGDLIKSVRILRPNGEIREHHCDKNSFSYRKNNFLRSGEIIIEGTIIHLGLDDNVAREIKEYLEYRKKSQPLRTKNCGSVFKNYSQNFKAGATIDRLGLKSFGDDHLKVSELHGNFVENLGEASALEFKELVECLKIDIERYTGNTFELEVKVY